jgi:RNA polymerase sigma factor (TIGR02999 family)
MDGIMPTPNRTDTSNLLARVSEGDKAAADKLIELLYDEFRHMAAAYLRREPEGITLQPTALVHEAFLKLVDQKRVDWKGRTHFLAVGAQAMRRILVDQARKRKRAKRGFGRRRVVLNEQLALSTHNDRHLLAVDEALAELATIDPRQAEIVELRFFGGMTLAEVAAYLGVSKGTVDREWRMTRAWLRRELSEDQAS